MITSEYGQALIERLFFFLVCSLLIELLKRRVKVRCVAHKAIVIVWSTTNATTQGMYSNVTNRNIHQQ